MCFSYNIKTNNNIVQYDHNTSYVLANCHIAYSSFFLHPQELQCDPNSHNRTPTWLASFICRGHSNESNDLWTYVVARASGEHQDRSQLDMRWRYIGRLPNRFPIPDLITSRCGFLELCSHSKANPRPCFSSRKINLTFQVMLSWPALYWWEKSFPSGPSWFTVAIGWSRANTSISRLRIIYKGTNQCGMWNVEQENMPLFRSLLQSLFTLYSMWLH